MAKRRIAQYELPRLLSNLGFTYYNSGTLQHMLSKKKTHIFFEGDCNKGISIKSVLAHFPESELMTKRSEYAPENVKRVIAFPIKTVLHYLD